MAPPGKAFKKPNETVPAKETPSAPVTTMNFLEFDTEPPKPINPTQT